MPWMRTMCGLYNNICLRFPSGVCPCIVCMCVNPKVSAWLFFWQSETKQGADQRGSMMTCVNVQRDGCGDFPSTVKVRDRTIICLRAHPTLCCPAYHQHTVLFQNDYCYWETCLYYSMFLSNGVLLKMRPIIFNISAFSSKIYLWCYSVWAQNGHK